MNDSSLVKTPLLFDLSRNRVHQHTQFGEIEENGYQKLRLFTFDNEEVTLTFGNVQEERKSVL